MGDHPQLFPILLTYSDAAAGERPNALSLAMTPAWPAVKHIIRNFSPLVDRLRSGLAGTSQLFTEPGHDRF
jgi:hypothetical protein